ncbi:MAG: glycosyltransferase family 87 protein, partial [Chloroflexota bacterium]
MGQDRRLLVWRLVLANVIVLFFLWSFAPYWQRFVDLIGATDWGSDWRWLQDGYDRLAQGLPLTRPEYVAGPWSQFPPPAHSPTYAWSLHPPYSATVYAPFLLVPEAVRQLVWTATMALAFLGAILVAWPRRLWWGTGLLLLALFLHPPVDGLWLGLIDQVHYGNPNALVALGVALVWLGRRRGSMSLMAIGLILASLKILPAATLGVWLLVARDRREPARRAVFVAVLACAALTVPVL